MKSELLLPVGNMAMCLAAIHHGADAVYFGVPFFNARGRSADLNLDELKEMIDLCHLYGVRTNLAFNVVIFQHELPKVIELLELILPLGPDALIVQDLGLASLIREMAPHQRIHASTQMTVTNADAIGLLEDLKIDRFVLGRENSISEIKDIRSHTDKELEVFVHGALCVAYSGQCFTSESIGGRSANRGQCAQSCRLEYELFVDDVKKEMGDKKYLVSPKDLMGIAQIGDLKEAGVNSFKVEGRLKTPEYVASAARNYREVIDGKELNLKDRSLELSSTYSRGFFSGWLNGVDHQNLVDGTFSSHRGLEIGKIIELKKNKILISSTESLKAGMGLLFVGENEVGSKIFAVEKRGASFEVELLGKTLALKTGMKVYLNSYEGLDRELQKGWQAREFQKKIPLKLMIHGLLGEPLHVKAIDPDGREVYAQTISNLTAAQNRKITELDLKEELGALGASAYKLESFECYLDENLFMNHREIKDLRKELIEKLNKARTTVVVNKLNPYSLPLKSNLGGAQTKLNIILRTKEQVDGFLDDWDKNLFQEYFQYLGCVILDFEFGKDYSSSVDALRERKILSAIATTRILKPREYHHLKTIIRCNPDRILVRNLGAIQFLKKETTIPLMGDFSLNMTNSLTAKYLVNKGLESICTSYDLNQGQLVDLIEHTDAGKLEVTLHQYMPEFHMEHCVFAAFLSKGHSFRDCGKPCEKHEVKLKDPYGNWHHLKADQECRNTFFKATPQSASFLVEELKNKGIKALRVEALNEKAKDFNQKILIYLKLLKNEISSEMAVSLLELKEAYGLSEGQIQKTDTYRDRKKQPRV
jgi:U32 family peptidase